MEIIEEGSPTCLIERKNGIIHIDCISYPIITREDIKKDKGSDNYDTYYSYTREFKKSREYALRKATFGQANYADPENHSLSAISFIDALVFRLIDNLPVPKKVIFDGNKVTLYGLPQDFLRNLSDENKTYKLPEDFNHTNFDQMADDIMNGTYNKKKNAYYEESGEVECSSEDEE